MSDYKSDQKRFFEQLRDLEDFAEADEKDRQQKYKAGIDKIVKRLVRVSKGCFGTEPKIRAWVIQTMKEQRKLPTDYTYPE